MIIIPSHIVTKRYQEAPDDFEKFQTNRMFQSNIKQVVSYELERISKLVSCQMATDLRCQSDPYSCYEEMHRDALQGVLKMRSYRETIVPIPRAVYSSLRTIHDLHHVLLNLPFDYDSEAILFHLLSINLTRAGAYPVTLSYVRNELYNVALITEGLKPSNKVVMEDLLYA